MDNITHSLTGAAIAEAYIPRDSKIPRGSLLLASALANNAPDFEAIWTSYIMPGKLGYLLFHRGHSHTLLGWPFLSLFFILSFWLFFKFRKKSLPREYWVCLITLCFVGPPVHLFLDYVGNYGLHPFWPWNNNWFYGDSLFIIDPLVWFLYSGTLFYVCQNKILKGVFATHIVLTFLLLMLIPFIPWSVASFQILLGILIMVALLRIPAHWRMRAGYSVLVLYFLFSFGVSSHVRSEVIKSVEAEQLFPKEQVQDVILSPYPANPLCWRAIVVRADDAEDIYELWSGYYTLPGIPNEEASLCSLGASFAPNIVLEFIKPRGDTHTRWLHVWRNELSTLRELREKSCHFEAFLHYSRAPAWKIDRDTVHISDLRYDRNQEVGFAEMTVPITRQSEKCPPPRLPVWHGPRMRLL